MNVSQQTVLDDVTCHSKFSTRIVVVTRHQIPTDQSMYLISSANKCKSEGQTSGLRSSNLA